MRKVLIVIFMIGFSILASSQSLINEYRYLALVKTQPKQLIKDNLRNAEIVADYLIFTDVEDHQTASLFFMELGDNYSAIKSPEFAVFSYLRQRFCFPNDSISLYVEKQIRLNALLLNIDKQMVDHLIQKSTQHNISTSAEKNMNDLIYWITKIETKALTPSILHQVNLMNSKGIAQTEYLMRWEDISRIAIPLKYKADYLENDFNSLDFTKKQRYYKYQIRYYLKQKAWMMADNSISLLNKLSQDNSSGFWYLKLRANWHF